MQVYTCVHILHVNVYHVWLQCVFAILPTFIDYMGFVRIMYMYVCMYIDILYRARSSLSGLVLIKAIYYYYYYHCQRVKCFGLLG